MASSFWGGSPPQSSPPPDIASFQSLLSTYTKKVKFPPQSHFVKKINEIPKVPVKPSTSCLFSLQLDEDGMIGKIMGLWPYPRAMAR